MSWMWWLAAPIVSTACGAGVLAWRDRRATALSRRDPILAHRALLDALERVEIAGPGGM